MISTVLIELRQVALLLFALVLIVCVVAGLLLRRRGARGRAALRVLAALSVLPALALTFVPSGDPPAPQFCAVDLSLLLPTGAVSGAQVVLLLPAAFFLALQARRPWLVLVAGVLLVLGIELTQALLPALGRSCDTEDVWLNSLGVLVGVGLAVLVGAVAPRLGRRSAPSVQEGSTDRR